MKKRIPDFKHDAFYGLIGVAQEDITPPTGIYSRSWGAAKHDVSEGIHRPLLLTCITLQTTETEKPFILISADLGTWRSSVDGDSIRNEIIKFFLIPPSQLMFCLTHTHAGPVLSRDDSSKPGGYLIEGYLNKLMNSIVHVIQVSLSSAFSGTITWNYGKCKLATNRDLYNPAGNRFVTGFNPKKIADDTLLVGRISDSADKIRGTIVNYACHPTTLAWENKLTSPDFIGAMREVITQHTDAPCLFLQGASGDLAPRLQYVSDTEIADRNGRQLGYSVLATIENMLPPRTKLSFGRVVSSGTDLGLWELKVNNEISAKLQAVREEVIYNLKPIPTLSEIEQQYQLSKDRIMKERLWRQRSIRINLGDGDISKTYFWVWRIGDALLIGQPNEAYSEFQLDLRKELFHTVAVINLVNGSAGYLVPREYYNQDIYQVWQTPFAAGSLEHLHSEVLKVVKIMSS